MSGKGRLDCPDTVESAVHFLMKLAADGWGIKSVEYEIEHGKVAKSANRLPVEATLKIRLIPAN